MTITSENAMETGETGTEGDTESRSNGAHVPRPIWDWFGRTEPQTRLGSRGQPQGGDVTNIEKNQQPIYIGRRRPITESGRFDPPEIKEDQRRPMEPNPRLLQPHHVHVLKD